ncbi:hypothetical protein NIES2109_41100 [Nostoc sp. HK-01]|nr:hypothetical protein NIES2109_41100 [Nostoc sp. HK-01]
MSLAGIKSHSQQLNTKKPTANFCNPINCAFFVGSFIILSTSSIIIISSTISSISSAISSPSTHPTSIPWINNASDCKHSGRNWYDNKCWDAEHSLMF